MALPPARWTRPLPAGPAGPAILLLPSFNRSLLKICYLPDAGTTNNRKMLAFTALSKGLGPQSGGGGRPPTTPFPGS